MKRILAALLTLTMLLCAGSALAEDTIALYEADENGNPKDTENLLVDYRAELEEGKTYVLTGTANMGMSPYLFINGNSTTLWLDSVTITDGRFDFLNLENQPPYRLTVKLKGTSSMTVDESPLWVSGGTVIFDTQAGGTLTLESTKPERPAIHTSDGGDAYVLNDRLALVPVEGGRWHAFRGALGGISYPELRIEPGVECTFKYPLGMELTAYVPDSAAFDPNAYKDYDSMCFHDGYVLEGWVQEETGKFFPWTSAAFGGNRALASEGTVFAAREIKGAQITWMALDDSGRMEVLGRQTVYPGDLIQTANGRNAPGKAFKNWKLPDADALLEAGEFFYADRDMTFIAQYEPADTVKLTFKDYEGEIHGVEYVRRDDVFIMKYCGRYGVSDWIPADSEGPDKYFVGWKKDAASEPIRPGVPYQADGDTVFQAEYSEDGDSSPQTVGFRYQGYERELSYDPMTGLSPWKVADCFGYPTPEKQLVGIEIDGVRYNALTDVIGFTPEQLRRNNNIFEVELILAPRTAPRRLTVPIANLPETGDPSMLMGWVCLLGAAAMGLKRRR